MQDDDAELYSANYITPGDPYHSLTDESRTNTLLLRSAKQRESTRSGADLLENVQPNVRRPGKSKGKKRKILDASIVDQSPGYYIKKYKAGLCVRPKTLCEVCGVFVIGVRRHLLNHRQESLYGCPHCPVKMKQKSNIMAHINTVHFKTVGKTCGICGKGFVHHKTYRYHMLTHESTGKRFECKDCSKTFSNQFTQRDHFKRFHSFECK
ncbi:zinc finger protein 709-like [Anopheles merus]|uniref:zinc finger protein 709-like n=1 Tax=Anopheles merus TaxID=30066 RepID=UPI001BE3D497|nr:zinc finger protein 709-like [Anopheles merus]